MDSIEKAYRKCLDRNLITKKPLRSEDTDHSMTMDSIEKAYGKCLDRDLITKKLPRPEDAGNSSPADKSRPAPGRMEEVGVFPNRGADAMRLSLIGQSTSPSAHANVPINNGASPPLKVGDIRSYLNLNLDRLVIGHEQDCDIWIDDRSVGRYHALLTRRGDEYWIEDLDGTGNTSVNDSLVARRLLHDGDRLRFGAISFRFVDRKRADRPGWERALIAVSGDALLDEGNPTKGLEVRAPGLEGRDTLSRNYPAATTPTVELESRPTLQSEPERPETQDVSNVPKPGESRRSRLAVVGWAAVAAAAMASVVSFTVIDHWPHPLEKEGQTKIAAKDPASETGGDRSDEEVVGLEKTTATHVPQVTTASELTESHGAIQSEQEIEETTAVTDQPPSRDTATASEPEPQVNPGTPEVAETQAEPRETWDSSPGKSRVSMETATSGPLVGALLRLQEGNLEASLALAEEGLAMAPEHAGLQAIKDEVLRRLDERARLEAQIGPLLAMAQEHRRQKRLMAPPGNNAYETFKRVLTIDPENQAARQGLMDIADDYLALARQAGDNESWGESLAYVERGLSLAPAHPRLLALRDQAAGKLQVGKRVEPSRQTRQDKASPVATAKRPVATAKRPVATAGPAATAGPVATAGPASQTPPKAGEPVSQRAVRDTTRFVSGLSAKARQLKGEGRIAESRTLVETGLRLAPRNPELLQLKKELQ